MLQPPEKFNLILMNAIDHTIQIGLINWSHSKTSLAQLDAHTIGAHWKQSNCGNIVRYIVFIHKSCWSNEGSSLYIRMIKRDTAFKSNPLLKLWPENTLFDTKHETQYTCSHILLLETSRVSMSILCIAPTIFIDWVMFEFTNFWPSLQLKSSCQRYKGWGWILVGFIAIHIGTITQFFSQPFLFKMQEICIGTLIVSLMGFVWEHSDL